MATPNWNSRGDIRCRTRNETRLLTLLGAVATIVVAQASAPGLANAGLTLSTSSADILIVLIFGAASAYALLLVHRYRDELRHHAMTETAMATAPRHTAHASRPDDEGDDDSEQAS
jgi:uncharacterized membrane protein YdfJ with MMPL/SSD domain